MNIHPYLDQIKSALRTSDIGVTQTSDNEVNITTDKVILTLYYDTRDRIIQSLVRPLGVPKELIEDFQTYPLLRMLGYMDEDEELKPTCPEEIPKELQKVSIVMDRIFLRGRRKIQEAYFFCEGYNTGYTDALNDSVSPQ